MFRSIVLSIVSMSVGLFGLAAQAWAVDVQVSWTHATTNEDGSALTDRGGYKVFYGETSGVYAFNRDAKDVNSFIVTGLEAGKKYYFAVATYNTKGDQSDYSSEASLTIPSGPALPPSTVDTDKDGISDSADNCPTLANADQADTDSDGLGDICDPNPTVPNSESAPLDFDGDGISDLGTRLQAAQAGSLTFRIIYSSDASVHDINHGKPSDIDAHGDYNSDGLTDLAVVHREKKNLVWIVRDTATGAISSENFGKAGSQILAGCDFDADFASDKAYFRNSSLTIKQSANDKVVKVRLPRDVRSLSCANVDGVKGDEILVYVKKLGPSKDKDGDKGKKGKGKAKGARRLAKASKTSLIALNLRGQAVLTRPAARASQIFASDMNGDGLQDLAYASRKGNVSTVNFFVGSDPQALPLEFSLVTSYTSVKLKAQDGSAHDGLLMGTKDRRILRFNFQDLLVEDVSASGSTEVPIRAPNVSGRVAQR